MNKEITDHDRRAVYYHVFRYNGERAIDAFRKAKAVFNATLPKSSKDTAGHIVYHLLPAALAIEMWIHAVAEYLQVREKYRSRPRRA